MASRSAREAPPETAPPPIASHLAPAGPILHRRQVWFEIPNYPGLKVLIYANFPTYLIAELQARTADGAVDEARVLAAIGVICVQHNGWLREDGTAYPPIATAEFWDAIPPEVAAAIIAFVNQEARRLPPSRETATPTANGLSAG